VVLSASLLGAVQQGFETIALDTGTQCRTGLAQRCRAGMSGAILNSNSGVPAVPVIILKGVSRALYAVPLLLKDRAD